MKVLITFLAIILMTINQQFASHTYATVEYSNKIHRDSVSVSFPVINVIDFGAMGDGFHDDTKAIQAALVKAHALNGATVIVPDGTYNLTDTLTIFENTTLIASKETIFFRNKSYSPMLLNGIKNQDSFQGYDGRGNITLIGGVWEGNGDIYQTQMCQLMFIHSKNITIKNVTVRNNYNSHHLELNACQNVRILNSTFEGYGGTNIKEAIQLDLMKNKGVFPYFGQYDNTTCDNVLIDGNTFRNLSRGIGSHSSTNGFWHTNITIRNNSFSNLRDQAIRGDNYKNVEIMNNDMKNVNLGIELYTTNGNASGEYKISGNAITKTHLNLDGSGGYGIWINGNNASEIHTNATITKNTIKEVAKAAIRIDYSEDITLQKNVISDFKKEGIKIDPSSKNINTLDNIIQK